MGHVSSEHISPFIIVEMATSSDRFELWTAPAANNGPWTRLMKRLMSLELTGQVVAHVKIIQVLKGKIR
jgi:hypothetical protein